MQSNEQAVGRRHAVRIALAYLLAALGWIYLSDRVSEALPLSASQHGWFQTVKGFVFVAVTAAFLFVLLRGVFTAIARTQADLFLTQFVVDHAADPIYWIRPDGTFSYVNRAACESLGYTRDELMSRTIADIDPDFSAQRWEQAWKSLLHFGVLRLETSHRAKDGKLIPVEVTANLVEYQGKTLDIAFVRDISERKAAEKIVQETRNRLSTLIDVLPGYVFMKDTAARYVIVNRRFSQDFGLEESSAVGHTDEELFGADLAGRFRANDRPVLEQGENVHLHEEQVPVGGIARTLTTWKVPLRDAKGRIEGLVGLALDISDRKEMEIALRRANEALKRANAELEQYAYAAAHDLREPLRTIGLYIQILERRHLDELSEEATCVVRYILDSARRMESLVNDLLAYTQVAGYRTDIGAEAALIAADTAENLKGALSACRGELRLHSLPRVAVAAVHLRQLLQNLIGNALQYRHPERLPRIELSAEQTDGEAVFRVSDNGMGIRPEYHEQIFGLFKRLHGLDVPGNGIGLALCRKIVEHYGGRIWVESEYGEGSTFAFSLPLT